MTVRELIHELMECDLDARVIWDEEIKETPVDVFVFSQINVGDGKCVVTIGAEP